MTKKEFQELCQCTVILDGATGSNLFRAGMPRGGCTEEWVLDHEEVLIDLQRRYVEAGSQVVYAPTFGASQPFLASYGLAGEMESMNKRLVELSRIAVDGKALVAGDITGSGSMIGSSPNATFEKAVEKYGKQIRYLVEAGVDLLVIETMISVEETMAALEAAQNLCELPVMCTFTIQADGSIYSGGHIFEAVETLQGMGADAVGINCSVGPDQLESIVRGMKERVDIPLIVKPNAGMPFIDEKGEAIYDMTPEDFAKHMRVLLDCGAGIVGGCCGTAPEYIKALKNVV